MSMIQKDGLVPSFFVAYCQRDELYAQRICGELREMDFDVHCMTDNPYSTPDFIEKGEEELARRVCVVAVVGIHKSDWVDTELLYARKHNKRVFPVLCGESVNDIHWPNGVDRFGVYVHIRTPDQPDAADLLLRGLVDFGLLDSGIVPRVILTRFKSSTVNPLRNCEQFASELVEQPIQVKRVQDDLRIVMNRGGASGCKYVVISNAGKSALQKTFVYPKRSAIEDAEHSLSALIDRTGFDGGCAESIKLPEGVPMRWASGGVMPIVMFRRKQWVALLFRDIAPYGWNLPLGASERYSGESADFVQATKLWEDELRRPERLATREFLEEILVVDGPPGDGNPLRVRQFSFVNELLPALHDHYNEFSKKHIDMRNDKDRLFVETSGGADIPVSERHGTKCFVDVLADGRMHTHHGFLVSVNPSEMGIEMVLPVAFALGDHDCMLDGEILSWQGASELVRMPVALLSVEYLRRNFAKPVPFNFVNVPLLSDDPSYPPETRPPSVTGEPLTENDVHVFDWDVRRRREIAQKVDAETGNELGRHQRWVRLFSDMFNGDPSKLPPWFTPTTAKTIRMAVAAGLL